MESHDDDSASLPAMETAQNKDATPLKKPSQPQEDADDDESKEPKAVEEPDRPPAAASESQHLAEAGDDESKPKAAAATTVAGETKAPSVAAAACLSQPLVSNMPESSTSSRAEKISELERQSGLLQTKWEDMFSRLEVFRAEHGHCLVPNRYEKDPQLGAWVSTQRRQYKIMKDGSGEATPMTKTRAARLEAVGFKWSTSDPRHVPWEKRYAELVQFKEKYNHTQVPIGWEENIQLSNWVSTQRQEFKLLQKGRSSRLNQYRITQLNKLDFIWEAQRGGPRRKRKATVVVPPNANPVEGLGGPNSRQRIGPGGVQFFPPAMQYGMMPGFSMMGGPAELPFVNMGMSAAAMQTAAAAAVAATPPWAMMGFGAFQQGPGGAPFPSMMFPMAQQQMPWAMGQMPGRFPGGPMPGMAVHPPPVGETPATPATDGSTGDTKTDTATPNVSTTVDTPPTMKAPPEAASTSPAKESTEPAASNSTGPPMQTAGATTPGSTAAVEDVQTEAEAAADADAVTEEHAVTPGRATESPIEAAPAETRASTETPLPQAEVQPETATTQTVATASDSPKDGPDVGEQSTQAGHTEG